MTTLAGYQGCRHKAAANTPPFFPLSSDEMDDLETIVATKSPTHRCWEGICMPVNSTDLAIFEANPVTYADMIKLGAKYGQFTRSKLLAKEADVNPALSGDKKSRYWIEVFRYGEAVNSGAVAANAALPTMEAPYIYRITAIAQGRKEGTRVVIRSIFVPYPALNQNQ
ncbi:MAG: pilus assembly protein [Rhodoferax sp.]|nr:pilus assembly protein [Rhodoferax sp.]